MFKSLTEKLPPQVKGPVTEPDAPRTLQWAVRLMLTGAAAATFYLIFGVIMLASQRNSLINELIRWNKAQPKSKQLTLSQIHSSVTVYFVTLFIIGLISVALWLWMARMNAGGRSWARITATVLFALWTIYIYLSIGAIRTAAILTIPMITLLVIWVIGLGALYFLWSPPSTVFFKSQSGR